MLPRNGGGLRPGLLAEHFFGPGDDQDERTRKWRFGAGVELRSGDVEVEPFYLLEVEQDQPEDVGTHIFGLGFDWEPWPG